MIGRTQNRFRFFLCFFFCGAGLYAFSKISDRFLIGYSDIYFFSGRYCCSNVAAADAVEDVVAAAVPVFVACYHCHLPRSLNKHGASIKAAYPLLISQGFRLI